MDALVDALAAWRERDVGGASIHPTDRAAVDATEAARALVLDRLAAVKDPRDLYNACARLGRLLAEAGASPTLAAGTIDNAVAAARAAGRGAGGTIEADAERVAAARASLAEGYVAAVVDAEQARARRAWDYPASAVRVDAETIALACGHPEGDAEALADWAARVALAASKERVKRVILAGSKAACAEARSALSLVGIDAMQAAQGASAGPRDAQGDARPDKPKGWLRLPWRK